MTINILELALVIFIAALGLAAGLVRVGQDTGDDVPTLDQEVHP